MRFGVIFLSLGFWVVGWCRKMVRDRFSAPWAAFMVNPHGRDSGEASDGALWSVSANLRFLSFQMARKPGSNRPLVSMTFRNRDLSLEWPKPVLGFSGMGERLGSGVRHPDKPGQRAPSYGGPLFCPVSCPAYAPRTHPGHVRPVSGLSGLRYQNYGASVRVQATSLKRQINLCSTSLSTARLKPFNLVSDRTFSGNARL